MCAYRVNIWRSTLFGRGRRPFFSPCLASSRTHMARHHPLARARVPLAIKGEIVVFFVKNPPVGQGSKLFSQNCLTRSGKSCLIRISRGPVAQSVEQRIENPCVDSSILSQATRFKSPHHTMRAFSFSALLRLVCICGHLWPANLTARLSSRQIHTAGHPQQRGEIAHFTMTLQHLVV